MLYQLSSIIFQEFNYLKLWCLCLSLYKLLKQYKINTLTNDNRNLKDNWNVNAKSDRNSFDNGRTWSLLMADGLNSAQSNLYPWSCNHKRIGIYYLLVSLCTGFQGTFISIIMRIELDSSGIRIIPTANMNIYNLNITLHGLLMIFFLVKHRYSSLRHLVWYP